VRVAAAPGAGVAILGAAEGFDDCRKIKFLGRRFESSLRTNPTSKNVRRRPSNKQKTR
jgi:hypothetical protein